MTRITRFAAQYLTCTATSLMHCNTFHALQHISCTATHLMHCNTFDATSSIARHSWFTAWLTVCIQSMTDGCDSNDGHPSNHTHHRMIHGAVREFVRAFHASSWMPVTYPPECLSRTEGCIQCVGVRHSNEADAYHGSWVMDHECATHCNILYAAYNVLHCVIPTT